VTHANRILDGVGGGAGGGDGAPSGHFTHTFGTAGTIAIHCTIPPDMRLTVFVQ
jgi:plastocyanin